MPWIFTLSAAYFGVTSPLAIRSLAHAGIRADLGGRARFRWPNGADLAPRKLFATRLTANLRQASYSAAHHKHQRHHGRPVRARSDQRVNLAAEVRQIAVPDVFLV